MSRVLPSAQLRQASPAADGRPPWKLAARLLYQYVDVRRARRGGRVPRCLPLLSLETTLACNARCRMCGFPSDYPAGGLPLSTPEWLALIDEAASLGALVISLGGGEPLLRGDTEALVRRIDGHGITTLLHTNGSLLDPDRCTRLAESRRLAVAISLDSHQRERHDELRRLRCFDTLIAAARYFVARAPQVRVSFTCTVTGENFRELPQILALARDNGVRTVRFTPMHENLQHRFRAAASLRPLRVAESSLPELRGIIEQVIDDARRHSMITNSPHYLRRIPDFFVGPVPHDCYAGHFFYSVDPYGQIFPCYDIQSGLNLREAGGLARALASEAMQDMRAQVRACERRCWNIGTAEPSLRIGGDLAAGLPQLAREALFYLR
jgi:pyrroloquinoline quinone biosynthesis protein E